MVSNGTKTTAQEMEAMRSAAASPRPKTDPEVGSGVAGDAMVAAAVADWRRTECVIEGPDRDGLYRIRHAPTGLCWGSWAGNFQDPHTDPLCFMFFYDAPGSGKDSGVGGPADKILASIPDAARPKAPNTEAALLAAEPVVKLGQGAYERAWPDDGTVGPLPTSNVRPVTAPEQAEFDETLDAFGIGEKPRQFLHELADECERSGTEFGKGRANGIRETLREINDPPVCRLQFPDGSVPGNVREAAEGWKREYDALWKRLNPQAGEGAPLAPSPASSARRVTIEASYRAGYSAAMADAVLLVLKVYAGSPARTDLLEALAKLGANVPVPATLGTGGVQ